MNRIRLLAAATIAGSILALCCYAVFLVFQFGHIGQNRGIPTAVKVAAGIAAVLLVANSVLLLRERRRSKSGVSLILLLTNLGILLLPILWIIGLVIVLLVFMGPSL